MLQAVKLPDDRQRQGFLSSLPNGIKSRVVDLAAKGHSMRAIAKILADEGYKNSVNKPLSAGSIHFLVKNQTSPDWCWFLVDRDIKIGPFLTKYEAEEIAAMLYHTKKLIEDDHGKKDSARTLEIAADINEMLATKLITQKEIATALGERESWVSFINNLNKMPDSLLEYLRDGTVNATTLVKAFILYGAFRTEWYLQTIKPTLPAGAKLSGRSFFEQAEELKSVLDQQQDAQVKSLLVA